MNNMKRNSSSGGSRRGRLIAVGVQRKLFAITAMFAAVVTVVAGMVTSLDVLAEGESPYIITYNVNTGGFSGLGYSAYGTYNDLPFSYATTSNNSSYGPVAAAPDAPNTHVQFHRWTNGIYEYSPGNTLSKSYFVQQGDKYVCALQAKWRKQYKVNYVSDYSGTQKSSTGWVTDGATFTVNIPTGTNEYCFKGWAVTENAATPDYPVDYSGNSAPANVSIPYSALPDALNGDGTYYELTLYPVWGSTVKILYIDDMHKVNGEAKEIERYVDPDGFTVENITEKGFDLTWNTESDGSGTSYSRTAYIKDLKTQFENYATETPEFFTRWRKRLRYYIYFAYDDGTQAMSHGTGDYADFDYAWDDTPSIKPFYKVDQEYKALTGYVGDRYVFISSNGSTFGNTIGTLSLSDFDTSEKGRFAGSTNSERFAIDIKAVYVPEAYTITLQLNREDEAVWPDGFDKADYTTSTDYKTLSDSGGTNVSGATDIVPSEAGYTFDGWALYDSDGSLIKTVTAGGKFTASDFAGKGTDFTIRDQWSMNYRIVPHKNNGDCAVDPGDKTGTIALYTPSGAASITATFSENMYTKGYSFEGYSTEADSTTANIKDGTTPKIIIDKFSDKFYVPEGGTECIIDIYGQWKKNIKVNYITSVSAPNSGIKTQTDSVWLSTIGSDDAFTFTQPSTCNPSEAHYSFDGDWSTQPKTKGVQGGQPVVTSIPYSSFVKKSDSATVFEATVYPVFTPNVYSFVYYPYFEIDGVISDDNYVPDVAGLPEEIDPDTKTVTVTQNYDTIYANDGFQTEELTGTGHELKKWYIHYSDHPNYPNGFEKAVGYKITTDEVGNTDTNGFNRTIHIRARWHAYNSYSLTYDLNLDGLEVDGLYIGEYIGGSAPSNVTFYENEFDSVFTQVGSDTVYQAQMGTNIKAKGYKFGGWRVTYPRASNTTIVISDDYTNTSDATFNIPKSDFSDAYNGALTATAIWTPQFMAKYEPNTDDALTDMPAYSQMETGTYSATNKAFDATNPTRGHYHFRGWSFTSGENQEVINNGSDGNDDDYRPRLLCSDFRNNEGHTHEVEAVYNATDKGYFELTVYAIWEPMIVYTLTYDLNESAIQNGGSYIENSGQLTACSVSYDEGELKTYGTYVPMEMGSGFAANGYRFGGWQLSYYNGGTLHEPDNYRFTDLTSETFDLYKARITEADNHQLTLKAIWTPYYAVKYDKNSPTNDVEGMPGRTELTGTYTGTKVFAASDPTRPHYHFRGWSYQSGDNLDSVIQHNTGTDYKPHIPVTAFDCTEGHANTVEAKNTVADGGYFELTVYAVWEPKSHFTLYYDRNPEGLNNAPWVGQYLSYIDEEGNANPLSGMTVNGDEWTEYVFEEGMSGQFVDGYYPLTHTRLCAKGYKFVGWDMYYYRKANNEEGKRLAGPYKYRINNDGSFNSSYGIYNTWFNVNDCVDREFRLSAVWEPQYEVFFHEGVDSEQIAEVSGMPDPKYSGVVPYKNWRGNGVKVFRASVPKRSGYYFVGWSTRDDLDVDENPDDAGYLLRRNSIGPSVPKSACSTPQYNEVDEGYLRADLYAVWSEKPVYTICFDENADQEAYPNIEYIGALPGKSEPDPWTVILTEEQARAISGSYYEFDKNVVLAAKGYKFTGWHVTYTRSNGNESNNDYRLAGGTYGIYKDWIKVSECPSREFFVSANWEPHYRVRFHDGDTLLEQSPLTELRNFRGSSKVFRFGSDIPVKKNQYFIGWSTDPDYVFNPQDTSGLLRGTKNVNVSKTAFTSADYSDEDQGFLCADLYAVYNDKPVYHIMYDENTDTDENRLKRDPFIGEYIGADDPGMVWYELVTADQLAQIKSENTLSPGNYPLHRGNLKAKGYVFSGWKMYYTTKTTQGVVTEKQKEYPLTLSDNSFSIYGTWFDGTADYEYRLLAQWTPQFAVKFFPNGDNVSNMPDFEYSPLKEERRFTGNPAAAVFSATVPERENYYFAGWSTDPDYDVATQGIDGLLRRNRTGPSVRKDSCVNALYTDAYKGFLCAYVYAVWSPTPVYSVVYDPNKSALTQDEQLQGEYLSDSMPEQNLLDGQWAFTYTQTQMDGILASTEGDNNAAGRYPLLRGDLTAKGYVFTGWRLHWNDADGNGQTEDYPVSGYGTDSFRIKSNRMKNDTKDYVFFLTANWKPRFRVAFNANAGGDTVTNMPANNPSALFKASDFTGEEKKKAVDDRGEDPSKPPQREGYVFSGWSKSPTPTASSELLERTGSGVTVAMTDCDTPTEGCFNATLYAVWTEGNTVSYEISGTTPAGASALPETKSYPLGTENIAVEPGMTAPGYTFSGWSVKTAPAGFAVNDGRFTMIGKVVFVGSFSPVKYKVNYYRNASDGDTVILRSEEFTVTQVAEGGIPLDKTAPDAFDGKHEFMHWSATSTGSEVQSIAFDENVLTYSVFARWKEVFRSVYNLNGHGSETDKPAGGKWYDSDFAQNADCATVDTSKVPSEPGYTFMGWRRGSAGDTPDYAYPWQNGQSKVIPKSSFGEDNTVTLYAVWKKNAHTVTYYKENKTEKITSYDRTVDDIVTVGEGVSAPAKEGFLFDKWVLMSAPDGFTLSGTSFAMPDGDVAFYATYKPDIFNVVYKVDASEYATKPYEYDFEVTRGDGVTDPKKAGFKFRGWKYVSGLSSEAAITNGKFKMPAGTVVFEAVFAPAHQVSYKAKKDESFLTLSEDYAPELYAENESVTVKADLPDIEGYEFSGWSVQTPDGLAIDDGKITMPNTDVVIYGEYAKKSYDVIYMVGDTEHGRSTHQFAESVTRGEGVSDPVKAGSEFRGWKIRSGITSDKIDADGRFAMPAGDVVFEAAFLGKYTVRYRACDINGAEITLDPEVYGDREYYNGTEVTVAPALTDGDYIFDGWKAEIPDNLAMIQAAGGEKTFVMPESDVLLTGRFVEELDVPVIYTVTYRSGLKDGDKGYTADLGKSHDFTMIADANGRADHKVLANNSDELKYVREGYDFVGWKVTKANPDPNPAPGGKKTVVAPKAYAANGLVAGGEVITIDSSVVLIAQWKEKTVIKTEKDFDKEPSPGTGESSLPMAVAFNLAVISLLAIGAAIGRRKES